MNERPIPDDVVPESSYEPPAVVTLGTLAELTRGFGGVPSDGFEGVPGSAPT